jgi:putative membrane protein insertion efficiency factor
MADAGHHCADHARSAPSGDGSDEPLDELYVPAAPGRGPLGFLRELFLAPVKAYQRFISPALPRSCKYEPTCSHYAVDAVRSHGVCRGTVLAAWRILRCNPWSHGGYDPVSAQRLFRSRRPASPS